MFMTSHTVILTAHFLLCVITLYIYGRIFGLQSSISEYFYTLKPLRKTYLFNILILTIGLPVVCIYPFFFSTPTDAFFIITGVFLIGVIVSSIFKDGGAVKKVHYGCAVLAILFGMVAIFTNNPPFNPFWGVIPVIALIFTGKNRIYWIEVYFITYIILFAAFL